MLIFNLTHLSHRYSAIYLFLLTLFIFTLTNSLFAIFLFLLINNGYLYCLIHFSFIFPLPPLLTILHFFLLYFTQFFSYFIFLFLHLFTFLIFTSFITSFIVSFALLWKVWVVVCLPAESHCNLASLWGGCGSCLRWKEGWGRVAVFTWLGTCSRLEKERGTILNE